MGIHKTGNPRLPRAVVSGDYLRQDDLHVTLAILVLRTMCHPNLPEIRKRGRNMKILKHIGPLGLGWPSRTASIDKSEANARNAGCCAFLFVRIATSARDMQL